MLVRKAACYQQDMARIAVVDDEPDLAQVFLAILSNGHDVEAFTDGQSCINRFQTKPFDIIITDFMMPGMDGVDLYHELRRTNSEVPVIALTAAYSRSLRDEFIEIGFCDVLEKPIMNFDQFRCIVLKYVGQFHASRGAPQTSLRRSGGLRKVS
jgi:CheY-like chemotaxis protein